MISKCEMAAALVALSAAGCGKKWKGSKVCNCPVKDGKAVFTLTKEKDISVTVAATCDTGGEGSEKQTNTLMEQAKTAAKGKKEADVCASVCSAVESNSDCVKGPKNAVANSAQLEELKKDVAVLKQLGRFDHARTEDFPDLMTLAVYHIHEMCWRMTPSTEPSALNAQLTFSFVTLLLSNNNEDLSSYFKDTTAFTPAEEFIRRQPRCLFALSFEGNGEKLRQYLHFMKVARMYESLAWTQHSAAIKKTVESEGKLFVDLLAATEETAKQHFTEFATIRQKFLTDFEAFKKRNLKRLEDISAINANPAVIVTAMGRIADEVPVMQAALTGMMKVFEGLPVTKNNQKQYSAYDQSIRVVHDAISGQIAAFRDASATSAVLPYGNADYMTALKRVAMTLREVA